MLVFLAWTLGAMAATTIVYGHVEPDVNKTRVEESRKSNNKKR